MAELNVSRTVQVCGLQRPILFKFCTIRGADLKSRRQPADLRCVNTHWKTSAQDDVLSLLRRGPIHLKDLCKKLGRTERQIRNAIDGLRARGINVKWDGPKTWCLR